MSNHNFKYANETEEIIGAAMEVHSHMGRGFREVFYRGALQIELELRKIPNVREASVPVYYKGHFIGLERVDFISHNHISIELKARDQLEPIHIVTSLHYVESFNFEVGLLLNFGSQSLQFKRLHNKKFDPNLHPNNSPDLLPPNPGNQENPLNPG